MGLVGFTKPEQPSDPTIFSGFCSEAESVDDWVSKYAAKARQRVTAVVYVVRPVSDDGPLDRVAGFYTLSAYSLRRAAVSASWVTRNTPVGIPAILLGMLAVDSAYSGKGLGSALLQDVVIRSRFVAENIGAKVIVVDPLTPELESFYGKFGFRQIAETGMMAARGCERPRQCSAYCVPGPFPARSIDMLCQHGESNST